MARSTVRRRPAFSAPSSPIGLHHPVQHLAVVDLDDVVAALDAEPLQRVGGHHADFGVGGGRGGADRIGVELHELAEASRPRLLVAIDLADAIGAIGLWQRVEILRDIAGQRRRQIVAQRQPLLVVVLKRKHALVGPVLIGQEFAERVGIFDRRRLQRLEAIELIDGANRLQHFGRWRRVRRRSRSAKPRGTRASTFRLSCGVF